MSQIALILISLIAAAGVLTDAPEQLLSFYGEVVATGQELATAGDLRSMSNMLDYEYLRRGRYPREKAFPAWLEKAFKENPGKSLLQDHWGRPYVYRVAADQSSYVLFSLGPDGREGSADDLRITGP